MDFVAFPWSTLRGKTVEQTTWSGVIPVPSRSTAVAKQRGVRVDALIKERNLGPIISLIVAGDSDDDDNDDEDAFTVGVTGAVVAVVVVVVVVAVVVVVVVVEVGEEDSSEDTGESEVDFVGEFLESFILRL